MPTGNEWHLDLYSSVHPCCCFSCENAWKEMEVSKPEKRKLSENEGNAVLATKKPRNQVGFGGLIRFLYAGVPSPEKLTKLKKQKSKKHINKTTENATQKLGKKKKIKKKSTGTPEANPETNVLCKASSILLTPAKKMKKTGNKINANKNLDSTSVSNECYEMRAEVFENKGNMKREPVSTDQASTVSRKKKKKLKEKKPEEVNDRFVVLLEDENICLESAVKRSKSRKRKKTEKPCNTHSVPFDSIEANQMAAVRDLPTVIDSIEFSDPIPKKKAKKHSKKKCVEDHESALLPEPSMSSLDVIHEPGSSVVPHTCDNVVQRESEIIQGNVLAKQKKKKKRKKQIRSPLSKHEEDEDITFLEAVACDQQHNSNKKLSHDKTSTESKDMPIKQIQNFLVSETMSVASTSSKKKKKKKRKAKTSLVNLSALELDAVSPNGVNEQPNPANKVKVPLEVAKTSNTEVMVDEMVDEYTFSESPAVPDLNLSRKKSKKKKRKDASSSVTAMDSSEHQNELNPLAHDGFSVVSSPKLSKKQQKEGVITMPPGLQHSSSKKKKNSENSSINDQFVTVSQSEPVLQPDGTDFKKSKKKKHKSKNASKEFQDVKVIVDGKDLQPELTAFSSEAQKSPNISSSEIKAQGKLKKQAKSKNKKSKIAPAQDVSLSGISRIVSPDFKNGTYGSPQKSEVEKQPELSSSKNDQPPVLSSKVHRERLKCILKKYKENSFDKDEEANVQDDDEQDKEDDQDDLPVTKVRTMTKTPPSTNQRSQHLWESSWQKLNSARFRYLNEQMYSMTGRDAMEMFKKDPSSYTVYQEGYQNQVKKWPLNPVDVIIRDLRTQSSSLIIADFGCGDAKIAASFPDRHVHSFDLVATNEHVTQCDMSKVPLKDGSVDIAVFCLSLMGTNLNDYILEVHRVLKKGGLLKIAEVESRFENVDDFVKGITALGFMLCKKDLSHNMFVFLDFKKSPSKNKKRKLPQLVLKPCLYKKR